MVVFVCEFLEVHHWLITRLERQSKQSRLVYLTWALRADIKGQVLDPTSFVAGIQSRLVYLTKGVSAAIKGQVLSSTSLMCVWGGIGACMLV